MIKILRCGEWALAILATLTLISLHLVFMTHAGGLWRDEVNTIAVSTLSPFGEFLHWLDFDSFPILWLLIIRAWHAIGLGSDAGLRSLGFAVGIGLIAALWASARAFRFTFPFVSLLLLGMNSSVIRWGDSLRAYGFGMCLVVLNFSATWLIVRQPTRRNLVYAAVVAVLSVQTLYYNSLLLFAVSAGGIAVCLRRRWWSRIFLLLGVGGLAALSMLAYIPVFQHSGNWNALFRHEGLGAAWYWQKLNQTLAPSGGISGWIWLGALIGVVVMGMASLLPKTMAKMTEEQRDVTLFCAVALVIGAGIYYVFLLRLRYVTEPWYYLAFMAFAAATADAGFSVMVDRLPRRVIRLTFIFALFVITLRPVLGDARIRMTDLDLVALELGRHVEKEDFVIVASWHDGVSFNRYYSGPARWETIPPINDHRFHRPDLLLPYMTAWDQMDVLNPLYEQIGRTLRDGNRVWVVGALNSVRSGGTVLVLPPAPNSSFGWQLGPYELSWSAQMAEFIQFHALHAEQVPVPIRQPVSTYENCAVMNLSGWQ